MCPKIRFSGTKLRIWLQHPTHSQPTLLQPCRLNNHRHATFLACRRRGLRCRRCTFLAAAIEDEPTHAQHQGHTKAQPQPKADETAAGFRGDGRVATRAVFRACEEHRAAGVARNVLLLLARALELGLEVAIGLEGEGSSELKSSFVSGREVEK